MFCSSLRFTTFFLLINYSNSEDKTTTISVTVKPARDIGACLTRTYFRLGFTYYVEKKAKVTFPEAERRCRTNNAKLVNLLRPEKLNAVLKWIRNCTAPSMTGPYFVNVVLIAPSVWNWNDETEIFKHLDTNKYCAGPNYKDYYGKAKHLAITVTSDDYCYQAINELGIAYFICEKPD